MAASFISCTEELVLFDEEEEDESFRTIVGFSQLGVLTSKSSDTGLANVIGASGIGTCSMLELEELWLMIISTPQIKLMSHCALVSSVLASIMFI